MSYRYHIRRRYMTPAQKRRHDLLCRLATDAEILELGVSKSLERIYDAWEVELCISRLEEAKHIREEAERLSKPKKRGKK